MDPQSFESSPSPREGGSQPEPWYRGMNRYHWFVLVVAALGWLFDCLDQQLFILARKPAMQDLLPPAADAVAYSAYATSIFLIGWATGGLVFGVMGDRFHLLYRWITAGVGVTTPRGVLHGIFLAQSRDSCASHYPPNLALRTACHRTRSRYA